MDETQTTIPDTSTEKMIQKDIPMSFYIKKIVQYAFAFAVLASALLILIFSVVSILVFVFYTPVETHAHSEACDAECSFKIVETLPPSLNLKRIEGTNTTTEIMTELLSNAKESIKISSNFFDLKNSRADAGGKSGNDLYNIFENIKKTNPTLKISLIQQISSSEKSQNETKHFLDQGIIDDIVNVEISKVNEDGVQNSKFMIVDEEHILLGSADLTWQSLSNVKELGILIEHCHCLGHDLEKVFHLWSYFSKDLNNQLPTSGKYPEEYDSEINDENPAQITKNNETIQFYFGISPKNVNTTTRVPELVSLLEMIEHSTVSLNISISEFYPFDTHFDAMWNELENALRLKILENVKINMLVSRTNETNSYMIPSLKAIKSFSSICDDTKVCNGSFNVKVIQFPTPNQNSFEEKFTVYNNPKFVIADSEWVYISTSNWVQNSFYSNFGLGFWIKKVDITNTMNLIFDRDWNSVYSTNL
eukprot:gene9729-1933_t